MTIEFDPHKELDRVLKLEEQCLKLIEGVEPQYFIQYQKLLNRLSLVKKELREVINAL